MSLVFTVVGCVFAVAAVLLAINKNKLTPLFAIAALCLILLSNSITVVPTGYSGVCTRFGQVAEQVETKGIHLKVPFIDRIILVNNKQQDITIDSKIWGETQEKTPVYASDIVVTYQVSESASSWLYSNVTSLRHLIDDKLVASATKNAMVELTVETVTNRSYVEPLCLDKLQEAVNQKYGENVIIIKNIVINNMDFEESYNNAIAEKSIAAQNQKRQEIENQTAIAKAEADKQVAITNAEAAARTKQIGADADAKATLTQAEAEAEANRMLNESLSDSVIRNKTIEKWDGSLPFVSGDGKAIISIGGLE